MIRALLKDWATYVVTPYGFIAFAAAGTLTTLTGPFGTYGTVPLGWRALYWYGLIAVSILLGLTIRWAAERRFSRFGFWTRALITAPVFSVLFTGFLIGYNRLMLGEGYTERFPVWLLFLFVLSVPVFLNPIIYLFRSQRIEAVPEPPPDPTAKPPPRIFQRLPECLGRRILRVSVEDHYVHVFTEAGSERLLMRFGDAVLELDDLPGLQVHRSHWVARNAVRGFRVEGSRTLLRLSDGAEVPLSRKYRDAAEAAGCLSLRVPAPAGETVARQPV